MSLLDVNTDPRIKTLAQKIFDRQFQLDPNLDSEYDDRRKRLMYEDVLYNISYLMTAIKLDDGKVFSDYSVWLFQLICNLIKDLDCERIKEQMVMHYQILSAAVAEFLPVEEIAKAQAFIDAAIKATENAEFPLKQNNQFLSKKHPKICQDYLDALLQGNARRAAAVIAQAAADGISLSEIYQEILQKTMYEVGDLWHRNVISIDKEHFCTSTTQMVMSQFYQEIFSRPHFDKSILVCCVGSELHEMGGRMLSDLFEYNGWDSIYLGAAVPKDSIIKALLEYKVDVVGLSVTMAQYLPLCLEIVQAIRERFPHIKIAVGGYAFKATNEIWKKWPIDIYTEDAGQMVLWAQKNVEAKPATGA